MLFLCDTLTDVSLISQTFKHQALLVTELSEWRLLNLFHSFYLKTTISQHPIQKPNHLLVLEGKNEQNLA